MWLLYFFRMLSSKPTEVSYALVLSVNKHFLYIKLIHDTNMHLKSILIKYTTPVNALVFIYFNHPQEHLKFVSLMMITDDQHM